MTNSTQSNRGSVYLVTLVTVAAIASMILIGVKIRTATNTHSAFIEHMAESNNAVLDATEYALQTIAEDATWNTTAQTGTIFNDFILAGTTYTGTVTDTDTAALPTDATTTFRIKVAATTNTTTSAAQIDILSATVDYPAVLQALGSTHYWQMNESKDPVYATDSIGAYDGAYQSPVVAGAGTNDEGGIVPVFADMDDYIEVPWGSDFKQSNGSISLWFKSTGTNKIETYGIFGMLYKAGGFPSISLSVWNNMLIAHISESGSYSTGNLAWTPANCVEVDTWTHIVVTWGSDSLRLYVNGVQKGIANSNTDGLNTARVNKGGEQPLHIGGGYMVAFTTTSQTKFEGSIAHVAFIPSQLNATQVAELAAIKPDLAAFEIVPDSWAKVFE